MLLSSVLYVHARCTNQYKDYTFVWSKHFKDTALFELKTYCFTVTVLLFCEVLKRLYPWLVSLISLVEISKHGNIELLLQFLKEMCWGRRRWRYEKYTTHKGANNYLLFFWIYGFVSPAAVYLHYLDQLMLGIFLLTPKLLRWQSVASFGYSALSVVFFCHFFLHQCFLCYLQTSLIKLEYLLLYALNVK